MAAGKAAADARGREANRPGDIPRPGWRDILVRTKDEVGRDHVTMIAAGVAFYGLLAIFPAIAAGISIWGLVFDPQQIEQQITQMAAALPQEAAAILTNQAQQVAGGTGTGVSLAAIGGILVALYAASKGVKALIEGLNVIYDEEEKRGFIKLNIVALALTLGLVVVAVVALGMIVVVPAVLSVIGLGGMGEALVTLLRWPLLFAIAMVGLAVLYRVAPCRERPRWRWVSWGAAIAVALWIVGSIAFSVYVRNFGNYNETYGSIGAVVILLMWFWLSAFVVLLGAELDSEMERQTARDTTRGDPQPLGSRGAHAADTVGPSP